MNPDRQKVEQVVFDAVGRLNKQLPRSQRLAKAPTVFISGEGAVLDSLGLVNLVFLVEHAIEKEFRLALTLVDEEAVGSENGPFRTLGSLTDHICRAMERKANG